MMRATEFCWCPNGRISQDYLEAALMADSQEVVDDNIFKVVAFPRLFDNPLFGTGKLKQHQLPFDPLLP